MRKLILLITFLFGSFSVFSQSQKIGEPEKYYKEYRQKMDSLSKLSGKNVTGYLTEVTSTKKVTTIFYTENNVMKSMVLDTTRTQLPNSGTNRTVDSIRKSFHR